MDEERFVSARGNPRYLDTNSSSGEVAAQKVGFPSILDRFNDLLNKREEDEEEEVIVGLYELVLSELTFNSKPIITDLTIIAGEHREYAEGIADAICARILEVPVDQKLPSLYLLDSVVKNIGREYVRYFSSHLPEVFCEAYRQVLPNMRPSMRHLFGTWLTVFPAPVLRKIEEQLQISPSTNLQSSSPSSLKTSESPRPIHGIHVNPKYLEARRQFELSTVDSNNHHARGMSSTLKMYGQKPTSEYEEDDFDNTGVMPSQVGTQGLGSTGRTSFTLGAENPLPSSATLLAKYSSPFRIQHVRSVSPPVDEYAAASPSHFGELSDCRRPEMSIAHNNGVELQRPRALIDAYGNDESSRTPNYNPLTVDILNGIDKKLSTKAWQNTEEKEFDWEDMSPTLADRGRSNDIVSSSVPPFESFRTRHGYGTQDAIPVDSNFRRSIWSSQSQNSVAEASPGHGSNSRITGLHDDTTKYAGSHYPQEGFPHYLPQYRQPTLHTEGKSRNFRTFPSAGGEQKPLINSFPDGNMQFHGSSVVPSRIGDASNASWKSEALPTSVALSTWPWPPVNIQKFPPLPLEKQSMRHFDSRNASTPNQVPKNSLFPEHHFNNIGNKPLSSTKKFSFSSQQAVPDLLNPEQAASVQPPLLVSQEVRRNFIPPVAFPAGGPMPSLVPRLSHGYNPAPSHVLLNPIPGVHPSMPILNTPRNSLYFQGGSGLPPLPAGPRPDSSQTTPVSHNPVSVVPQAGGALSGLISSLVAQGLISLTKQSTVQDSVGLDFNLDTLKVRHESAITALYADLPRQCTTCGLRFKCQEQHSSHMDWHVTKNRISKTRKQKPSRKWFVSVSMWLTGTESLGTDAGPGFFLPTESIVEKKDGEEFAVAADEDQNVCALCGEPFDDFYSDETEEWMYKGAVYMNAPNGSTLGMDGSELGPIVHAKCRSESNAVSLEDFGQDERGYTEDSNQRRKRLRS